MGLLDDKVVMITGAGRGQGRAHAILSAQEGADVVLLDTLKPMTSVPYPLLGEGELEQTAKEVEAIGRQAVVVAGDVREQADLDGAVAQGIEEFGKIDCLIANAGIWNRSPFWEITEHAWQEMLDVNLSGVWRSAKAVTPHMIERGAGSIVLTASSNALEPGSGCNSVSPGGVKTAMLDNAFGYELLTGKPDGTLEELLQGGRHFSALKGANLLEPERIAETALYLNSRLAERVTGVLIPVDAGHSILGGFNHNPVE
jgi:NAD(P)-dependent dehydrogenase (short-subunit alcohol dehydrogenase family)